MRRPCKFQYVLVDLAHCTIKRCTAQSVTRPLKNYRFCSVRLDVLRVIPSTGPRSERGGYSLEHSHSTLENRYLHGKVTLFFLKILLGFDCNGLVVYGPRKLVTRLSDSLVRNPPRFASHIPLYIYIAFLLPIILLLPFIPRDPSSTYGSHSLD
jgi:hypothetical protein